MRILQLIIVILLQGVTLQTADAQTKRALVIGLGQQEDAAWGKINGDKDVPYVQEMLREAHYDQIATCVNHQATKAGIVQAFGQLTRSCQRGDIVYVHYSGHGQQMKDRNNDEPDELDECWIPYDAYRKPCDKDRGEKHLTDDEVHTLLMRLYDKIGEQGKMLVVIDACHSGDATRSSETEVVRGVEEVFETLYSFFTSTEVAEKPRRRPVRSVRQKQEKWITLSACESAQVNIEMGQPVVGKLTYALYNGVKDHSWNDNPTFFRKLRMFVNGHTGSRPQRPVMSGVTTKYNIHEILR